MLGIRPLHLQHGFLFICAYIYVCMYFIAFYLPFILELFLEEKICPRQSLYPFIIEPRIITLYHGKIGELITCPY